MERAAAARQFLDEWLREQRERVDRMLGFELAALAPMVPSPLHMAMSHSLKAPGKRLRPALVFAAARALGCEEPPGLVDFACAVEFVHTYSLIHDDLPALDNDSLRRGLPTCHVLFGEAMAILAGDALLTHAFTLASRCGGSRGAELATRLSLAAGPLGMVGGQADDIMEPWPAELGFLERLHMRKTGALIAVACAGGARATGATDAQIAALERYGRHLGLAFQIADDLLDLRSDSSKLGKNVGNDARNGKTNFPMLVGVQQAEARARREVEAAKDELRSFACADALTALADYAIERDH